MSPLQAVKEMSSKDASHSWHHSMSLWFRLEWLDYISTLSCPVALTFHWFYMRSIIAHWTVAVLFSFNQFKLRQCIFQIYSFFIAYNIHPVPCNFQCKSSIFKILGFYSAGLYRDCTWLVANAKQWTIWIAWPYKGDGGRIVCCPLASTLFNSR